MTTQKCDCPQRGRGLVVGLRRIHIAYFKLAYTTISHGTRQHMPREPTHSQLL